MSKSTPYDADFRLLLVQIGGLYKSLVVMMEGSTGEYCTFRRGVSIAFY